MSGRHETTPLHKAAIKGMLTAAQVLTQRGASVDAEDEIGYTPLHLAAYQGYVDVLNHLIQCGASVNRQNNEGDGYTPLHLASQEGHANIINRLIEHNANPNLHNEMGDTPLHLAARNGHADAVQALLKGGADPNMRDEEGLTAVDGCQDERLLQIFEEFSKGRKREEPVVMELRTRLRQAQQMASIAQKEVMVLRQRAQAAESALAGSRKTIASLHARNRELEDEVARLKARQRRATKAGDEEVNGNTTESESDREQRDGDPFSPVSSGEEGSNEQHQPTSPLQSPKHSQQQQQQQQQKSPTKQFVVREGREREKRRQPSPLSISTPPSVSGLQGRDHSLIARRRSAPRSHSVSDQ